MQKSYLTSVAASALVVSLLWSAAGCGSRSLDSAVLDKAEVTRLAARNPSNYGRPVRLKGVVTYCDPEWHLHFLQDESGGFFIDLKEEVADLKVGRLVEISGKLGPGNHGVEDPLFRVLGSAPMPAPQPLPRSSEASKARLSQWVRLHGTVRSAAFEDGRLTLDVVDGKERTKVRLLLPEHARPISFVGAEVTVAGVSAAAVDEKGNTTGIQMFVSALDQITLDAGSRELVDPFSSTPEPYSKALDNGARGKLVHFAGTVVEQKPGRLLVIGDGASKVTAALSDSSQFAPGDSVELLGFVTGAATNQLDDAIVRLVAPRTPLKEAHMNGALQTIAELKSLSVESAAKELPVDVRGTVTYIDPASSLLFLQDATAGAYVDIHNGSPELEEGDVVHIRGFSGPGDYAPIIRRPNIERVGHGAMPKAQALSLQTLGSGNNGAGWVETIGIVHSVAQMGSQHFFKFVVAGNSYAVQLPHAMNNVVPPEGLLDAQVRIHGVCGTVFNEKRQLVGLKFFVPNMKFVEILEPGSAESAKNVRPIVMLLRFDPFNLSNHRTTVRGAVTLRESERAFYVQDASAGMYVVAEQDEQVHVGQLVQVSGFAAVGLDGPFLEDASVNAVSETAHVEPVKLTPEDLASGLYRSQLVTMEGRLLERVSSPDEDTMILRDGSLVLRARLQGAKIPQELRRESLLEVTGILQSDGRADQNSFRIALPSAGDVRVIEAASWWTPENTARSLAVAVIVILFALLWVSYGAYRVRSLQARHDLLTGLPNRRATLEYLEQQMARAMRERSSLGVILADVDHFKKVNDSYGHQAGDAVLKKIAEILGAALRPYDAVGRYGGEEFLIVVPNCDTAMAVEISERIRERIMEEAFTSMLHAQSFRVTCSFGVAIAAGPPWEVDFTLAAADQALYAAKNSGRNKVLISELDAAKLTPQPATP